MSTPSPHDTAQPIRWDLSDLYASIDDPKIPDTLATARHQANQLVGRYKGKLATLSPQDLATAFRELERLLTPLYKLSQYAHLVYSVDTGDDAIKAFVNMVDESESEIGNEIIFFNTELASIPSDQLIALANHPDLADFRYDLLLTEKTAQFVLTEKEEQLINIKDLNGVDTFRKLYNDLSASFQFEFELDGTVQRMNGSQIRALRQHEDPAVRRNAMALFFKRYEDHQLIFTTLFNAVVKDFNAERKLRGYPTPISTKLIGKDLDDETIDTLHAVTNESTHLVQRYYTLKRKLIGLPELTLADIYAPLPGTSKRYSWEEAKSIVLDGFGRFDPEIKALAQRMFDKNRIDAPVLPTKRGGAYCSSSTPDLDPYIFLNFQGRPSDVATLAHELGHAIHDMLCAHHHLFYFHPILPLAETASVFSEMLITDKLLAEQTDPTDIQAILTDKLEDIFATSHRQNMFSNFERKTHDRLSSGTLSATELCDIYHQQLTQLFGDAVTITPEYRWEWATIPHMIESPFYVFSYNFGNLLVMALYQLYQEQGPAFIPKYKQILASGSAASPYDIVKIAGFELRDPNFWRKGIRVISELLDRLEKTVNQHD